MSRIGPMEVMPDLGGTLLHAAIPTTLSSYQEQYLRIIELGDGHMATSKTASHIGRNLLAAEPIGVLYLEEEIKLRVLQRKGSFPMARF